MGLACLVFSGLLAAEPFSRGIHRWTAHGMLIFAWLAFPPAIGLRYASGFGSWKFVALLVVLFLVLLLSSFTGYLGSITPVEHRQQVGGEPRNRFVVLHMCALPAVLCLLGGTLLWLAWRRKVTPAAQP